MLIHPRGKNRPYHLGPFPLETLTATTAWRNGRRRGRRWPASAETAPEGPLARAAAHYRDLFAKFADGEPCAASQAPVPDDLARRAADIKGAAYFLDAAQVGICRMPANAWLAGGDHPAHGFAAVILVERPRLPEPDNLAREWIAPARAEIADMRAAEIAVCVAGHIRAMGFAARAHFAGHSLVDAERLAVLAGLRCGPTRACAIPISTISPSPWSPPTTSSPPTQPLHESALERARASPIGWA